MPIPLLPWLIGAAGAAAAGYLTKKLSEKSHSSNSGPTLDEVARENEKRRRETLCKQQQEKMYRFVRTVLLEYGIEVSSSEHEHLVELALNIEGDAPLNAQIEKIAPRGQEVREIDQKIKAIEPELIALTENAILLRKLAGHVN